MEPKKNPKKDLNKNSGLYFIIGLVLVLALAYMALEWKTYDTIYGDDIALNTMDDPVEIIPPVVPIKLPPPPPPPIVPPVLDVVDNELDVIETEILSTDVNQDTEVVLVDDIAVIEEEENPPVPFMVIEDVPIFPGCENAKNKRACFQKMMGKHIKKVFQYPESAQEMKLEGRVNTLFVIQEDGSIGNIQLRGSHKILEAEAQRIVEKLPKMTPGKQRGKAVKVPFSQPITFKLQ
ncbi:MAG: energy transducer TonB [Bacteroidota bacterium]